MKLARVLAFAPWVPPERFDFKITMPPPIPGEVGGMYGTSTPYSHRLANTPHWKRMATSTYKIRMKENETNYPMSEYNPGEYDMRYLPSAHPDLLRRQPLLQVGEPCNIPGLQIPVIFLVDLWDDSDKQRTKFSGEEGKNMEPSGGGCWLGRAGETVFVSQNFMRYELFPQRYAIYATKEAYELLGLPVIDHHVHEEIPKSVAERNKLVAKQSWENERWKYSIEYLFRKYENGPIELQMSAGAMEWDPASDATAAAADGGEAAAVGQKKGIPAVKRRKARKIKLFDVTSS